jgi:glycosyltransferase involved in cell wall biosynthesis
LRSYAAYRIREGDEIVKPVILTKNACMGGVETIIAAHQRKYGWPVIVCGGIIDENCPFEYCYANHPNGLSKMLGEYDRIIYHWPPPWAVQSIYQSGLPSIEYVHRLDTADCDKGVPDLILTHSRYIADWLVGNHLPTALVPYPVDTEHYSTVEGSRDRIGGHGAYTLIKGVDISIRAASKLGISLRFYGSGKQREYFRRLAELYQVPCELLPSVKDPATVLGEFELFLSAARIEGGPLAIMEALASDIPAVASDIPAHLELNAIAKEMGYPEPITIFKTDDVSDMARAIARHQKDVHPREFATAFTSMERHLAVIGEILRGS